jgi:hypothetical protein
MIISKLSCSVVLATAFAAMGLGASRVPARADVITLDVSATFQPGPTPGVASCSPTCTIGGDIVIDNSFGAANSGFVSANVTATGFVTSAGPPVSVGPFTTFAFIGESPPDFTVLALDSGPFALRLLFQTEIPGFFAFYDGGQLSTDSIIATDGPDALLWELTSGSLLPAAAAGAVPEPGSLLLLLSATAGLLGTGSLLRHTASDGPGASQKVTST